MHTAHCTQISSVLFVNGFLFILKGNWNGYCQHFITHSVQHYTIWLRLNIYWEFRVVQSCFASNWVTAARSHWTTCFILFLSEIGRYNSLNWHIKKIKLFVVKSRVKSFFLKNATEFVIVYFTRSIDVFLEVFFHIYFSVSTSFLRAQKS